MASKCYDLLRLSNKALFSIYPLTLLYKMTYNAIECRKRLTSKHHKWIKVLKCTNLLFPAMFSIDLNISVSIYKKCKFDFFPSLDRCVHACGFLLLIFHLFQEWNYFFNGNFKSNACINFWKMSATFNVLWETCIWNIPLLFTERCGTDLFQKFKNYMHM